MSISKRKQAFLLPLALVSLLVTSMIAISGYTFIQSHISSIGKSEGLADLSIQKEAFEKFALGGQPPENPIISDQKIDLSGLYNASYLAHRDVEGNLSLIDDHSEVLTKLLSVCANIEGSTILSRQIENYVVANAPFSRGFGTLDLLNELSIPLSLGVKILPCLRVASRSYKLNLSIASDSTLQSYFDLSDLEALELRNYLDRNIIPNHSALKNYLAKIHQERDFSLLIRDTVISSPVDHRALVLYQNNETFAYIDVLKVSPETWEINRSFFLWIPLD